jgi:uncharacterized protein YjiS (DUF1127 family)
MALLQIDRDANDWLTRSPRPLALPVARRFAHLADHLLATIQRWSTLRQVRAWRTRVENARQRRMLAQMSDRELRDIGISRYEIEFLLRPSSRR